MSTLQELMAAAEQADSDYRVAVVGAAEARAEWELTYHEALTLCEEKSVAARKEFAEGLATELHQAWLIAEAQEKAARTHVQVLLGLLVAKQSEQKFAGKLDGGTDWGDDW